MPSASWKMPPPNLPYLPPEIWLRIIEASTFVPGALEPDIYERSDDSAELRNKKTQKLIKKSYRTKRSLVRVCKLWRFLATPYLYEAIQIGLYRQIAFLHATLIDSGRGSLSEDTSSRPMGWYAKRLDIALRDNTNNVDSALNLLAEIVQCIPRMSIFVVSDFHTPIGHDLGPIPQALADTCGASLRMFSLSDDSRPWFGTPLNELRQSNWHTLLSVSPHLRVLNLPAYLEMPTNFTFPEVTRLTLAAWDSTQSVQYPSLHTIEYYTGRVPGLWAGFFQACGRMLTMVHMHFRCRRDADNSFQAELNVISQYCPSLKWLTISTNFGCLWPNYTYDLPQVEYLGLRYYQRGSASYHWRTIFRTCARFRSAALKIVRLCDHRNVNDLRVYHTQVLEEYLEELKQCSFRFEDHEGHLLSMP